MKNLINIFSSSEFYANDTEAISSHSLGTEFLGWEPGTQILDFQVEHYGFTHIRTPGGLPVEDPWVSDTSSGRIQNPTLNDLQFGDYAYCLTDPNYVDWYRSTGEEREGIQELAEYSVENGITSISVVVPTARYAALMFDAIDDGSLQYINSDDGVANSVEEAIELAKSDITIFLTNYYFFADGTARDVPDSLTLELGSEYYETNLWLHFMGEDSVADEELALESLQTSLGLTFAALAEAIGDFEDTYGLEINTVIQLGRVQSHDESFGSLEDNAAFIEQFSNEQFISSDAIEAVDGGIWHRYVSFWDGFDNFLDPFETESVQSMLEMWNDAGSSGVNLVGGWMAPAVQAGVAESKYHVSLMLQMYSELMAAGMDMGTAFAGNSNNVGALSFKGEVMMGGQLYGMMNENLPDTYIIDGFDDNISLFEYIDGQPVPKPMVEQVNVHTFANDTKVVTYLTVGDILDEGLTTQLTLEGNFSEIQITHLYAEENPLWVENTQGAQLGYSGVIYTETIQINGEPSNLALTFMHDFELIQIVAIREDEAVEDREDGAFWCGLGSNILHGNINADRNIGEIGSNYTNTDFEKEFTDSDNGEGIIFSANPGDFIFGGNVQNGPYALIAKHSAFDEKRSDSQICSNQNDSLFDRSGTDTIMIASERDAPANCGWDDHFVFRGVEGEEGSTHSIVLDRQEDASIRIDSFVPFMNAAVPFQGFYEDHLFNNDNGDVIMDHGDGLIW